MKIHLIAVGKSMPTWVTTGFFEYAKRLPKNFQLELIEIAAEKRSKTSAVSRLIFLEGQQILTKIPPQSLIIALDEHGKELDTKNLALSLQKWQTENQHLSLIIGGPDGLAKEVLTKANLVWSLSKLTLPHPLVRIVVAEQIYRAWSILHNHPYHRA
jgi:23S rRNA (pseudouridine1915-N3)-methyltransferase